MQYKTNKFLEEVGVLEVTQEEYDHLNKCYKDAIRHQNPSLYQSGRIGDVTHIILTDGMIRASVIISKLTTTTTTSTTRNNDDDNNNPPTTTTTTTIIS